MKRKGPVITALEHAHNRPFAEIVAPYAAKGWSRAMTAEALGVHVVTFTQACRRLCPEIEWPHRNASPRRKAAYRGPVAEKARQRMIAQGRARLIEHKGKRLPLTTAARQAGIHPATLYTRYRAGWKGKQLFKKPHPTQGKPDAVYSLGLSVSDLQHVLEYARAKSINAAANKFGVPQGAIRAMLMGEWERVA